MNRRMIAAALACLACTAGLSACSLTGTGDTHHIAVIIKHAGEHFQNVMAGAEACASEHPNVTIDIQFPSSADYSAEQLDLFRSALDDDSVDAVVISPMQSGQLSAVRLGGRPPKVQKSRSSHWIRISPRTKNCPLSAPATRQQPNPAA